MLSPSAPPRSGEKGGAGFEGRRGRDVVECSEGHEGMTCGKRRRRSTGREREKEGGRRRVAF
jgi:hypothetical protein